MNITHWISIAQALATAFVGIVAVTITWKMQSKQIDIANGVKEIARGQHETAATKLRLELFEKRFKAYQEVVTCMDEAFVHEDDDDYAIFDVINAKYDKACAPIRYLFDLHVYNIVTVDIKQSIDEYFNALRSMREYSGTGDEDEEAAGRTMRIHIHDSFATYTMLSKAVEPFLIIEKESL
jgi:hypothetical protein